MTYLLDACALLAMINGEPGADIVMRLFNEAERGDCTLSLSIVQLLEVYYDRIHVVGREAAKQRVEWIIAGPVSVIDSITVPVMYEAGRLKTSYHCSLADAIGIATAIELSAQFVTSDHHDFEAVEKAEGLSVLWLPPRPKK
jgi:predicted nucleic acid-binding protein